MECINANTVLWLVLTSNRREDQNARTRVGWEHLETLRAKGVSKLVVPIAFLRSLLIFSAAGQEEKIER